MKEQNTNLYQGREERQQDSTTLTFEAPMEGHSIGNVTEASERLSGRK